MLDDLERLRVNEDLQRLLGHYAEAGAAQPEAWQDRVMHLEGVEPRDLTKLHGQLLAYGWLDQNTGLTPVLKPGVTACCYRVNREGVRALKQTLGTSICESDAARPAPSGPEPRSRPRKRRTKRDRTASPEAVPNAPAAGAE
jgi:hypothetical protein